MSIVQTPRTLTAAAVFAASLPAAALAATTGAVPAGVPPAAAPPAGAPASAGAASAGAASPGTAAAGSASSAAATAPKAAMPVAADYKIHPGDQIAVSVYGEPTLTQNVTVLPDQTIAYPMIGRVSIGGRTPAQATSELDKAFSKYIRNPIVSVGVISEGQVTVMVLGNVKTPGKYALPYGSHVTDAVAAAGGLGPTNGDYPVARVSDNHGVRDANLQAILRQGDPASDARLTDTSIVYVPSPVTFNVEVVGAVDRPGEVQLSAGDKLSTAIAKAGNSANANADLNNIRVTRTNPDGSTKVFSINLYKELQHGDVASDIALQKNDVVYVPQAKKGAANAAGGILGIIGHFFGF